MRDFYLRSREKVYLKVSILRSKRLVLQINSIDFPHLRYERRAASEKGNFSVKISMVIFSFNGIIDFVKKKDRRNQRARREILIEVIGKTWRIFGKRIWASNLFLKKKVSFTLKPYLYLISRPNNYLLSLLYCVNHCTMRAIDKRLVFFPLAVRLAAWIETDVLPYIMNKYSVKNQILLSLIGKIQALADNHRN